MMNRLLQTKLKYLFFRSYVRALPGSQVCINSKADIFKSHIIVGSKGRLEIGVNVRIINASIYIKEGCIKIDDNVLIGSEKTKTSIYVENGNCIIGRHAIIGDHRNTSTIKIENGEFILGTFSKFAGSLVWIRFGGILNIGDYTNINCGSELRCDEKLNIGSYNQISYNVRIWDTNTHSKLSKEQRRYVTESRFPYFGFEDYRPETSPVIIGDDCWIGEGVAILKGCSIGDRSIIGFGTLICGKNIPSDCQVVNERKLKIVPI